MNTPVQIESHSVIKQFFVRTYLWMSVGLILTLAVAALIYLIVGNNILLTLPLGLILPFALLIEIAIVIILSWLYKKLSSFWAGLLFLVYSILNGLTFGFLALQFEISSVITAILATAITFLVIALFGYFTKQDLTQIGSIAIFGLFALVIGTFINIIVYLINPALADGIFWILNYLGLAIFVVLIAFDNQKLKQMAQLENSNSLAIRGALMLYLDFINLFIRILYILGKRK